MINGRIVCYGTPSYLMQEYGGGYEVSIVGDCLIEAEVFGSHRCVVQHEGSEPGTTNKITVLKVEDKL